jgi:hypothetical protein
MFMNRFIHFVSGAWIDISGPVKDGPFTNLAPIREIIETARLNKLQTT